MISPYEMPPDWYADEWPETDRIDTSGLIPVQGHGVRFAYPDGHVVHLLDLLPCLDGWTPEMIRASWQVQNWETDERSGSYWTNPPAFNALKAQAKRNKQTRQAARKGRVSKWDHLRQRAAADAVGLWKGNRALARSDSATADALARMWADEGIDPVPPRTTIKGWIAAIQHPPMQKVEH